MVRVAPIKLQVGPKVLWFDPTDLDIHAGNNVIVNTSRGIEFGTATADIAEVSDEVVATLKSPLQKVIRIATPEDEAKNEELQLKSDEALKVFKQIAAETNDDMRPVMVEFIFGGDKAIFYFEAEDRVDFRELVRRLASHFHTRVDMRQVGVRDAARMVGGLGHCGQELCCRRFTDRFAPVSIRMAKEQDLSLNPQKISGACGRLMCCLRYEYDTYKELKAQAPKVGGKVATPEGEAKVTEVNVPLEQVTLKLEDGKTVKIPLAEFDEPTEGKRPNSVSKEVFEKYSQADLFEIRTQAGELDVTNFTGEDKLADPSSRPSVKAEPKASSSSRRSRRRRGRSQSGESSASQPKQQSQGKGKDKSSSQGRSQGKSSRRSRSRGSSSSGAAAQANKQQGSGRKQRPGQNSSGIQRQRQQGSQKQGAASSGAPTTVHRRSRRRSHTTGGDSQ